MGFRMVILTEKVELSLAQNYLLVTSDSEKRKIHMSELDVVMIENPRIRMTGSLINRLGKENVITIFCDEFHNPSTYLLPLYNHHKRAGNLEKQIKWSDKKKASIWKKIVEDKITSQICVLSMLKSPEPLLSDYQKEVVLDDETNREAMAAKLYFHRLFGATFSRHAEDSINWALNYGYTILMSYVTRKIVALGYLTEIGIKHNNNFNEFNLSCDLMEVFRPVVDYIVYTNVGEAFTLESKRFLQQMHNLKISVNGKKYFLPMAIDVYVSEILKNLSNESGGCPLLEVDLTPIASNEP